MKQQIGKGVYQGCILSPCLFNLYAEHIMRNDRLDEAQAGIEISGRNINNLRYADDITLMAESEEEIKSLLMAFLAPSACGAASCSSQASLSHCLRSSGRSAPHARQRYLAFVQHGRHRQQRTV